MNYTDKLQLKKPAGSDYYDIADFNYNADTIDAAITDNLTTDDGNKMLSAKQGKVLNDSKVAKADIADSLTTDDSTKVLSAKQGKVLNESKVNISDIVDNLVSTDTDKPLSAKQGKVLNDGKVAVTDIIDNLTTDDNTKVLSAKQGKALQDTKEALANKVTSISSGSTDTQYPSALCVYNAITASAGKPQRGTVNLSASWIGSESPYSQPVLVSGATVTANSKVDIQPNSALIAQMVDDGCNAIYLDNNNGTVTAYAIGEKPTSAFSGVQVTVTEMA